MAWLLFGRIFWADLALARKEKPETHLTLCDLNRQLTTTTLSVLNRQLTHLLHQSHSLEHTVGGGGRCNVAKCNVLAECFFCPIFQADVAIFEAALPGKQQKTTDTATAAVALSSSHRWAAEVVSWLVGTFDVSIGLMWHSLQLPCQETSANNYPLVCGPNRQLAQILQWNNSLVHAGGWHRPRLGLAVIWTHLLG